MTRSGAAGDAENTAAAGAGAGAADALRFWSHARLRGASGLAYAIYFASLVTLIAVAPLVRVIWLLAADPVLAHNVAGLLSGGTLPVVVVAGWATALAVGMVRGPVVLAPFLAHTLAHSPIPQRRAFRRQVWMPAVMLAVAGALIAGTLRGIISSAVGPTAPGILAATVTGAAVGAVTAGVWLAGQACSSRTASVGVGGLVMVVAALALAPARATAAIGSAVASLLSAPAFPAVAVAVTAVALCSVPLLCGRLRPDHVVRQSLDWERAVQHAGMLDLPASALAYTPMPHSGRRRSALGVRGGSLHRVVMRADMVGAARTPARLVAGVLALVAAGTLLAGAVAAAPATGMLAALGGVVAYVAVGPLTDGVRHAAEAADTVLYGASDLRLLLLHALFPITVAVIAVAIGAALVLLLAMSPVWASGVPALSALPAASTTSAVSVLSTVSVVPMAGCAVALRIAGAFKPPLPIGLLTPIPTPAGDLAALGRLAWALDSVLLAAIAGATLTLLPSIPLIPAAVIAAIGTLVIRRWRNR